MQKKKFTEEELKYINENHKTKTAIQMAGHLKVSLSSMHYYLRLLGLKAFNSTKKMTHLKETIIKENYDKVKLDELSNMVDISKAFLRKYIELNFGPKEVKPKNYSFDNGKGYFDVDMFCKAYNY